MLVMKGYVECLGKETERERGREIERGRGSGEACIYTYYIWPRHRIIPLNESSTLNDTRNPDKIEGIFLDSGQLPSLDLPAGQLQKPVRQDVRNSLGFRIRGLGFRFNTNRSIRKTLKDPLCLRSIHAME